VIVGIVVESRPSPDRPQGEMHGCDHSRKCEEVQNPLILAGILLFFCASTCKEMQVNTASIGVANFKHYPREKAVTPKVHNRLPGIQRRC